MKCSETDSETDISVFRELAGSTLTVVVTKNWKKK